MDSSLFKYFLKYIFASRTRQKLIFLAIIGLLISSFSLTVLQGVMGGLQNGLVNRSKNVLGHGYLDVSRLDPDSLQNVIEVLESEKLSYVKELELELMVQSENFIYPTIVHGIDYQNKIPKFLENKDKTHTVVGADLGRKLRSFFGSKIIFTSPAHVDFIFQEIPRQSASSISDYYSSELPEIDGVHSWVRIGLLQNLIREEKINRLRFYTKEFYKLEDLLSSHQFDLDIVTWENEHSSLVWALNLETKVMLFLFIGMSFLIGICITSGFLIFYNKVKVDLASFWILGYSRKKILSLVFKFGQLITIFFCLLGVGLGVGFLLILKTNDFILMPEEFVERSIPVHFSYIHMLISFLVPYLVASMFTQITFNIFKKENYSFLSLIRRLR